jgi:hypothetical protein
MVALTVELAVATPLHYDTSDNLFVQLQGRKRVWLLPPMASLRLPLQPLHSSGHRQLRLAALARRPGDLRACLARVRAGFAECGGDEQAGDDDGGDKGDDDDAAAVQQLQSVDLAPVCRAAAAVAIPCCLLSIHRQQPLASRPAR